MFGSKKNSVPQNRIDSLIGVGIPIRGQYQFQWWSACRR